MSERPAAFLDRDGVLNELVPDPDSGLLESPLRVEDVRLLPGVVAALGRLAQAGFMIACVSNQPAAAKGTVPVAQLTAVHERVLQLLARDGARIDASRICLHHPDGIVGELARPCDCRKPAPGMLLDVAAEWGLTLEECWMVGDTDADMAAGRATGCRTALIAHPGSGHKRSEGLRADVVAADLPDAVAQVIDLRAR